MASETKYTSATRAGLYLMMFITMLGATRACSRTKDITKLLEPQVKVQNVIGQEAPEKFYVIDGKRAYLEIDGRSVEQHVRE